MEKNRSSHDQILKPHNNKRIRGLEEWLLPEKKYKNWSYET